MRIGVSASSRLTTGAGTFVHIIKPSIWKGGYNGLAEGATVHFDVIDRRGKQLADNLRVKRGWRRHSRRNEFHRKKDEGNSLEPPRERARIYGIGQELPNPKGGRRTINN
jgi:cold shock CspA family protein